MVNTDNINKTIEVMRLYGDTHVKFDMDQYVLNAPSYSDIVPTRDCGTSCCLAGFVLIAKNGTLPTVLDDIGLTARDFLGLGSESASNLFLPSYEEAWNATLEDGIKMLETVRDTGSVDWRNVFPDAVNMDEVPNDDS